MDEREQVTMDTVVGIIPSRLQSSRLPQKALLDICGLPMFIHVYRRCQLAKKLDRVIVATDSEGIMKAAAQHGCEAIMTQEHHQTGTDRIAEVAAKIDCDIVVNIQGDEALVNPRYIDQAIAADVDLYLTGEASEQTVHSARENGISFIAAGHHATERYGVRALGDYLARHFALEHLFIDCPNPV